MSKEKENQEHSPHVDLARTAIESWVKEGRRISPRERPELMEALTDRAGVFVSLKKQGRLRGCIGTFQPTRDSLAEEIIGNAISAACRDPRFPPLVEKELEDLDVSVDVLGEPEPVPDASYLDPMEYGVIVKSGARLGLLLPDLEGVDSVSEQLEIARRKAGIEANEPIQLFRFDVKRYH
ncbi:MAG: AmmeMemoRadiSam system protein A [Actinomycetota bacterium]